MRRIRGGRGLGDSIYLRPFVDHFLRRGEQVTVLSEYPEIFAGLQCTVDRFDRSRSKWNVLAHYTRGKAVPSTTQWEDICNSAGVALPLAITWTCRNPALVQELRAMAKGRPIVLVHAGRTHEWAGTALLPKPEAFAAVLAGFRDCFTVAIGKGARRYSVPVSLDMQDRTSVSDLIDLAQDCAAIVGQCSYAVPLAEVFDKPLIGVWAADGMKASQHPFVRQVTPRKVLSKPSSMAVIDDWSDAQIRVEVDAFRLVR